VELLTRFGLGLPNGHGHAGIACIAHARVERNTAEQRNAQAFAFLLPTPMTEHFCFLPTVRANKKAHVLHDA
jgi:hypothetical protein